MEKQRQEGNRSSIRSCIDTVAGSEISWLLLCPFTPKIQNLASYRQNSITTTPEISILHHSYRFVFCFWYFLLIYTYKQTQVWFFPPPPKRTYIYSYIWIQIRSKTAVYPLLLTRPESQCKHKHAYSPCVQYVWLNIMSADMFCWVFRMIFRT